MSAELAHFKCGRCSAVGHQTPDCILGYAQLWQSTSKVVLDSVLFSKQKGREIGHFNI